MHGTGLPVNCRKALEAMSAELNGLNPSFTIRRNIQQVLEDHDLVDELRKVIVNISVNPFYLNTTVVNDRVLTSVFFFKVNCVK